MVTVVCGLLVGGEVNGDLDLKDWVVQTQKPHCQRTTAA